jgi:hypothetical protein
MRRRPLTKPRETVSPYKQILLELLDGKRNVNYIYKRLRQTGLRGLAYKQKILHAIKYLEKAGFVVDVSDLKRHKSGVEQFKELTVLGKELAELMNSIDLYYSSFSRLTDIIVQVFGVPYLCPDSLAFEVSNMQEIDQKNFVVRNTLRGKGWSSEAIDRAGYIYQGALNQRMMYSPDWIFNIVMMRYAAIISRSSVNDNDEVDQVLKKDILNGIITNAISGYISYMFKEMDRLNSLYQTNRLDKRFTIDAAISDFIEWMLKITGMVGSGEYLDKGYNMFIEKEALDTLASIVSIAKPRSEYVDKEIEYSKSFQQEHEGQRAWEGQIIQDKKVMSIFEQYKEMKNKVNTNSR